MIAHIRNFYEYSLSPDCPFVPEWKRQGGDYYREKMETLRFGQDVFIPFLEQHTELTPEDEKFLAEIMATESDWNRKSEDKEQPEETKAHGESPEDALLKQAISCIGAYCDAEFGLDAEADYTDLSNIKIAYTTTEDGLHGIQASADLLQYRMETYIDGVLVDYTQYDDLADFIENGLSNLYFHDLVSVTEVQLEPFYRGESREKTEEISPDLIPHAPEPIPHYTVEQTSDAFADPFIIRDNNAPEDSADRYYDVGGIYQTFETEEEAQEYADALNRSEISKNQIAEPVTAEDNSDLIGRGLVIDNRRYVMESVGKISGDVSMRDITFQNSTGFPINRVEKIGYVRRLLEQAQEELPPEEKAEAPTASPTSPAVSADRHNYRITDDALGVGGAKEKFRNNMAAIRLLHDLQIENRLATPEEQETLAKYVGWGGLSMAFDEKNASWANEYKELKAELSDEEYRAAKANYNYQFDKNGGIIMPLIILAVYMAAHVSERYFRVSFPMEEFMDKMKALASDYLKQAHHTQDGITWDDALKNIPKTLWEKYGFYKADGEYNIAYPPDFHVTGDAFLIFPKSVQLMQAASSMTSYLWVRLDQEILEQSQEGVMDRIQEFVCIWVPRFVDFGYDNMTLFVEKALKETDPDFWEVFEEEEEFDPDEYGCESQYAQVVSKL